MKKTISALLAVATVAGSLVSVAPAAKADGGRIAAGVAGGLRLTDPSPRFPCVHHSSPTAPAAGLFAAFYCARPKACNTVTPGQQSTFSPADF